MEISRIKFEQKKKKNENKKFSTFYVKYLQLQILIRKTVTLSDHDNRFFILTFKMILPKKKSDFTISDFTTLESLF